MRRRYRMIGDQLVEVGGEAKERLALHAFSSDEMEPTKHPVTGEYYTSKTRFRQKTRELGFEEVGNAYANGWEDKTFQDRERQLKKDRIEIIRSLVN